MSDKYSGGLSRGEMSGEWKLYLAGELNQRL
jgi:hypothetical protein